ncbi:MAG: response regulator transcription factor [Pirellulales bacterium]
MGITLLVVDNNELMHAGLKALLARTSIEIIAAADGDQALRLTQRSRPDVALVDVGFSSGSGYSVLESLKQRWAELPVVMWSCQNNPTYVARARALGAAGFLLQSATRQDTISAIRTAAKGQPAWMTDHHRQIAEPRAAAQRLPAPLTPRETDVARQLSFGLTNREIAMALSISQETVKEHVQNLLLKLNLRHRTQVAVWAVRNGLDGSIGASPRRLPPVQ